MRLAVCCIALMAVLAAAETADSNDMDAMLGQAHALRRAGRYEEARTAYAALVADENAPAHYRCNAQLCIGDSYATEEQYDQARNAYAMVNDIPEAHPHFLWDAKDRIENTTRKESGRPIWDIERTRTPAPIMPETATAYYVSPTGSDDNPGTEHAPFLTPARALEAVLQEQAGGTVYLREGTYRLNETLHINDNTAPVVIRAHPAEKPRITGGVELTGFTHVTNEEILRRLPESSRNQVLQLDLRAAGINDYGAMTQRGMSMPGKPLMELFFNGDAMRVARWPNEGFVYTGEVHDSGSREEGRGAVFTYLDDRPERWTEAKDIWMFGYWYHHWADCTLDVAAIDLENKRIHTNHRSPYDIREGQHYYYFNLLEEIDAPGEWYVDRDTGILYFYPPAPVGDATIELSMLDEPFFSLNNASQVYLAGVTLDVGRDHGVVMRDSSNCVLIECTLSRLGNDAIMVNGGRDCIIIGNEMHTLARGGIRANSGNRVTLDAGNLIIENNHVHDFSRIDRSYTPAVWLDGVGNRIAHNHFHDSPHQAIRLEGNEHVVEFNEIHHVVYETDDQSGIDMWGNPAYRGNVIRYNFWHHIASPLELHGQAGIRLDDAICDVIMYGNVFYKSSGGIFGAIQIHGGKENVVDNNLFVDCKYAVSFSPWPPERWLEFLDSDLGRRGIAGVVDITKPPYSEHYPALARIREDANVNMIWRNLVVNCGEFLMRRYGHNAPVIMDNLEMSEDPGFADLKNMDFTLVAENPIYQTFGFRYIPFDLMGNY